MRGILRKYGFFVYWLGFAAYTLDQAQHPGLIAYPEKWVYPWKAVFLVWGLLAVLIGIFYLILRPMSFHHSWRRLIVALVFGAVLLAFGIASVVTDMPGYYYVPAMFSLVTMAMLIIFALVQIALHFLGSRRHA